MACPDWGPSRLAHQLWVAAQNGACLPTFPQIEQVAVPSGGSPAPGARHVRRNVRRTDHHWRIGASVSVESFSQPAADPPRRGAWLAFFALECSSGGNRERPLLMAQRSPRRSASAGNDGPQRVDRCRMSASPIRGNLAKTRPSASCPRYRRSSRHREESNLPQCQRTAKLRPGLPRELWIVTPRNGRLSQHDSGNARIDRYAEQDVEREGDTERHAEVERWARFRNRVAQHCRHSDVRGARG